MKKIIVITGFMLGLCMASFAQGGLFHRGPEQSVEAYDNRNNGGLLTPGLPTHGETEDQGAPLGSGLAVLFSLGAAYAIAKKREKE